jgi:hypothetical protein
MKIKGIAMKVCRCCGSWRHSHVLQTYYQNNFIFHFNKLTLMNVINMEA